MLFEIQRRQPTNPAQYALKNVKLKWYQVTYTLSWQFTTTEICMDTADQSKTQGKYHFDWYNLLLVDASLLLACEIYGRPPTENTIWHGWRQVQNNNPAISSSFIEFIMLLKWLKKNFRAHGLCCCSTCCFTLKRVSHIYILYCVWCPGKRTHCVRLVVICICTQVCLVVLTSMHVLLCMRVCVRECLCVLVYLIFCVCVSVCMHVRLCLPHQFGSLRMICQDTAGWWFWRWVGLAERGVRGEAVMYFLSHIIILILCVLCVRARVCVCICYDSLSACTPTPKTTPVPASPAKQHHCLDGYAWWLRGPRCA